MFRYERRGDFLPKEVKKTQLLRTTDRGHTCLQLLLEEGKSGCRLREIQVSQGRPECLILDRTVLFACQGVDDSSASDSNLRPGFSSLEGVGIQLFCCKCDA